MAIPGQIAFGHLSDRIGREWVWTIGNMGFVLCCVLLILLHEMPTKTLLYAMVLAQGTLGYSLTSVMGAIPAEIFEGRHFGRIFGSAMVAAILGGAAGPWLTGALYDATGSYSAAFWIAAGCSTLSALAIWLAAPRKVRAVAGRADRLSSGPKRRALITAWAAINFADSSFGDTEMAQPEEPGDRTIRGPARIIETVNKVVRTAQQMLPEIGREPTPEELAEKLAMPLDKVHRVLAIANRPIRLETPIGSG